MKNKLISAIISLIPIGFIKKVVLIFFDKLSKKEKMEMFDQLGYNASKQSNYYSPFPTPSDLRKNIDRWNKPSGLGGIAYDLDKMKDYLQLLVNNHFSDYQSIGTYRSIQEKGFGIGYPELDAMVLYAIGREIKPKKYIEVGSGLSTYFGSLAFNKNREEGTNAEITCVEPYPFDNLYTIPNITILDKEVQEIELDVFQTLEKDDFLFIDSSHVVRIDGDVPYLFLEVLPKLKKGTIIHVHDIPFPFNIPYPSEHWVFGEDPQYWTEAMLLQALLSNNKSFEIIMSLPLIRYYDEPFLIEHIPNYKSAQEASFPDTFSSVWLRKID